MINYLSDVGDIFEISTSITSTQVALYEQNGITILDKMRSSLLNEKRQIINKRVIEFINVNSVREFYCSAVEPTMMDTSLIDIRNIEKLLCSYTQSNIITNIMVGALISDMNGYTNIVDGLVPNTSAKAVKVRSGFRYR